MKYIQKSDPRQFKPTSEVISKQSSSNSAIDAFECSSQSPVKKGLIVLPEAARLQLQQMRDLPSRNDHNEATGNERHLQALILKNLGFSSLESYRKFVLDLSKTVPSLPVRFPSIPEFASNLRVYIEAVAHNQILSAWNDLKQNKKPPRLQNPKITVHSISKTQGDCREYKIVIDLKDTDFSKEPMCDHLHNGVFLLKYKNSSPIALICISESFRLSGSPSLTLRFMHNSPQPIVFTDPSLPWQLTYLDSITECCRSYAASYRLPSTAMLNDFVTGHIPDFLISNIEETASQEAKKAFIRHTLSPKFILSTDQVDFIYHILYANDSLNAEQIKFVYSVLRGQSTICPLWGPPGTGKTTTIVALTRIALHLGLRILITSSTNQSISEVAVRLHALNITQMSIIGIRKKFANALDNYFCQGWSKRLEEKFVTVKDNFYTILETYFSKEADTESSVNTKIQAQDPRLIDSLDEWCTNLEILLQHLQTSDDLAKHAATFSQIKTEVTVSIDNLKSHKISEAEDAISTFLKTWEYALAEFNRATFDNPRFDSVQIDNKLLERKNGVIFSTLSTLGRTKLRPIDIAIYDEAGQIDRIGVLTGLAIQSDILVISGDPRQLPAFRRFQNLPPSSGMSILELFIDVLQSPHGFLDEQNRYNNFINGWISPTFYDKKLKTGKYARSLPTFSAPSLLSIPIAFINTQNSQTKAGYANEAQARLIAQAVRKVYLDHSEITIGVIAYYVAQRDCLKRLLSDLDPKRVIVCTVDGAQGTEFDCLFVSAPRDDAIGFVQELPRINVSLTRGKISIFLFGNELVLSKSSEFYKFIQYVRGLNYFFEQEVFAKLCNIQKSITKDQATSKTMSPTNKKQLNSVPIPVQSSTAPDYLAAQLLASRQRLGNLSKQEKEMYQQCPGYQLLPDITAMQVKLQDLNAQLHNKMTELSELEKERDYLKDKANDWINDRFEEEKNKSLQVLKANHPVLSATQKKMEDYSQKLKVLADVSPSLFAELKEKQKELTKLQTEHNSVNTQFEKIVFTRLHETFKAADKTMYASLAFATFDPFLRWALFCRLSYIAYAERAYWQAIFYIMHIEKYDDTDPRLEHWYVLYKAHVNYIYQSCLAHMIRDNIVPSTIQAYSAEDCRSLLNSEDPYQYIVACRWLIENERLDVTIFFFNQLLQAYVELSIKDPNLNFIGILDALYQLFLQKILKPTNLLIKHKWICEDDSQFNVKSYPDNLANWMISQPQLNQDFQTVYSVEHRLKFVCLKQSALYQTNTKTCHEISPNLVKVPDSITVLETLKTELMKNTIYNWDQFMLISYQLMQCYFQRQQGTKISALFQEIRALLAQRKKDSDHSFILGWFFLSYSLFLLRTETPNGRDTAIKLCEDVLSRHPSMFELYFLQEQLHQLLIIPTTSELPIETDTDNWITPYNQHRLFLPQVPTSASVVQPPIISKGLSYEK